MNDFVSMSILKNPNTEKYGVTDGLPGPKGTETHCLDSVISLKDFCSKQSAYKR
jgi:hypothetical protein